MPESLNSPFSLISPHTNWSRDRKLFCLLSTDEFADMGLLSETAHLHGWSSALLCCTAISITGTRSTFARKALYSATVFTFVQFTSKRLFSALLLASIHWESACRSLKHLLPKKKKKAILLLLLVCPKAQECWYLRLAKALLAFSGLAFLRMKPVISHFETRKQH